MSHGPCGVSGGCGEGGGRKQRGGVRIRTATKENSLKASTTTRVRELSDQAMAIFSPVVYQGSTIPQDSRSNGNHRGVQDAEKTSTSMMASLSLMVIVFCIFLLPRANAFSNTIFAKPLLPARRGVHQCKPVMALCERAWAIGAFVMDCQHLTRARCGWGL